MTIDLTQLDQETKDRLFMLEDTIPTFSNCLSNDYTEILFNTLAERRNPKIQHSYIASWSGLQGSGKCINSDTYIYVKRKGESWLLDKIKNVNIGDVVYGYKNSQNMTVFSKILNVYKRKEYGYLIRTKRSDDFICSKVHKHIVKRDNKLVNVATNDLVVGDILLNYKWFNKYKYRKDNVYMTGFLTGVYLADGCIGYDARCREPNVIITKSEGVVKDKIQYYFKNVFGIKLNEYCRGKTIDNRIIKTLTSHFPLSIKYFESFGKRNNKKFIPYQFSCFFLKGLLDGYINCDSAIYIGDNKKNRKYIGMRLMSVSKELILALQTTIAMFGFCASFSIHIEKSNKKKYYYLKFGKEEGKSFFNFIDLMGVKKEKFRKIMQYKPKFQHRTNNDVIKIYNNLFENPITDIMYTGKKYDMIDIETETGNFFLANGILTHNSYSALSLAGFLDETFNISKIYFDIEQLVNERHKLRPHDCVIVDEMARGFGIDSNRQNIIIQTIKEQLRKKSIHFLFCSPTLKDEYRSSQYVFETMFLDKKNKLSFHAYKTNQLLCLGYVVIPHPINFISKKTLVQYERKKDMHLTEVLEGPRDLVEERARKIVREPLFIKAEKMYMKVRGYIPYKILVQIVEKIYPEFKGSVIVYELADRVKTNSEISGRWLIFGSKNK